MERLRFYLNDVLVEESTVSPTTTLLNYARYQQGLTGTKEGCAEGDCGACTVALLEPEGPGGRPTDRAVNSCLVFLPMLQGRRVYTVEGLAQGDRPHPVQQSLVEALGSQCGYCTPGIVMSMFEACYRRDLAVAGPDGGPERDWQIDDQMCGNLCRCTGYRPIREATQRVAGSCPADRFAARLDDAASDSGGARSVMALAYSGRDLTWQPLQRYHTPTTSAELFALLGRFPSARLVAGATDLGLEVTKKFRVIEHLIALEAITELRAIEVTDTRVRIGAGATLTEIQEQVGLRLPPLEKMLRFFASRQIRNRATLGGNLCTASPIGDLAPVLLGLGADLILRGPGGDRTVPIDEFFLSYRKTALQPGEVLWAASIPVPGPDVRATSFKVSKRRELDISAVAAGCSVRLDPAGVVTEARLAFGGMAAVPARARRAEEALVGRPFTEASVRAAMPLLAEDFRPIDDHRGSGWYRLTVASNLLLGFFLETRHGSPPAPVGRPVATVQPAAVSPAQEMV
jgi:xanthine dehydrogenase small subunit